MDLRPLLVLAALTALPAAQADVPHYLAVALEAEDGAGAVGPLAAVYVNGDQFDAPALAVAAQQILVESDRQHDDQYSPVLVDAKDQLDLEEPTWTTETAVYTAATADLVGSRAYRIFVAPATPGSAAAEVRAPFLRLAVDDRDPVSEPQGIHHPNRTVTTVPLAGAFQATLRTEATVRVTGDFLVVLWEADVAVRDESQERTWRSGQTIRQPTDKVPLPPQVERPMAYGEYEARKTYLRVTNGTLELTVGDADWEALHLHAEGAAASGAIILKEALQQGVTLTGGPVDVRLPGPVACTLAASGERLEAWPVPAAGPEPDGGAEAPHALDLLPATPQESPARSSTASAAFQGLPAWLGTSALALALSAAALAAARGSSQARAMRELRGHMAAGEYESAIEMLERPMRSRRHRREASVIGIVAALQLADVGRARELLRRARWSLASDPALEPFLGACIAAASHDEERARALLTDSLRMDGSLAEHAKGNPFLARVMRPEPQEPGYT
jgi:hypothetical protein